MNELSIERPRLRLLQISCILSHRKEIKRSVALHIHDFKYLRLDVLVPAMCCHSAFWTLFYCRIIYSIYIASSLLSSYCTVFTQICIHVTFKLNQPVINSSLLLHPLSSSHFFYLFCYSSLLNSMFTATVLHFIVFFIFILTFYPLPFYFIITEKQKEDYVHVWVPHPSEGQPGVSAALSCPYCRIYLLYLIY